MKSVPRTPLLYIVLGFVGGIVISRNAAPMSAPSKAAVILGMVVGGFVLWRAGYKGKSEAVATAVAIATANATAVATAQANAAINLYMNSSPDRVYDPATEAPILSLTNSDEQQEIEHDEHYAEHAEVQRMREGVPARKRSRRVASSQG